MKSRWREIAATTIVTVITECDSDGITDRDTMKKRINAAYPFGERAYHPYRIWLDEMKQQLDRRERLTTPLRTYWLDGDHNAI